MSGEEKHTHYFAHTGWNLCCKQATYLLLKKEESKKLGFREEFALKFHMMICRFCRAFRKQSLTMNEIIRETARAADKQMSRDQKLKLKLLINSKLNEN